MRTNVTVLASGTTVGDLRDHESPRGQHLYPMTNAEGRLNAVIARKQLRRAMEVGEPWTRIGEIANEPVVAFEKEPLRVVASRMAQSDSRCCRSWNRAPANSWA
jgi:hypothetical protein